MSYIAPANKCYHRVPLKNLYVSVATQVGVVTHGARNNATTKSLKNTTWRLTSAVSIVSTAGDQPDILHETLYCTWGGSTRACMEDARMASCERTDFIGVINFVSSSYGGGKVIITHDAP